MPEITDAYAHCGLRKYKPLAEVKRVADLFSVSRTVLVEHMGEFDNSYIASIVRDEPERFAGVFLVDMDTTDAGESIERWASTGYFRGIRMSSPSILTHRPLWERAAKTGLHFVVSAPFSEAEARALGRFAGEHPGNAFQLTHLGSPDASEAPRFPSLRPMLALSSAPNIHIQVSGMHQRDTPPYEALRGAAAQVFEAFGESRVLYGSNFPVMVEDEIYGLEIDLLRQGKLGVPAAALEAVMDGNARRLWFNRKSLRAGSLVWRCAFG